jgi:hypothetical protein
MTILRVERWLLGAALVAATLASGRDARARQDGSDKDKPAAASASADVSVPSPGATATASGTAAGDEKAADKGDAEKEEKNVELDLDVVIGTATTESVTQTQIGGSVSGSPNPTTVAGSTKVTSYSFVLGAGWELAHNFELAVRFPIVGGTIFGPYQRGASGIGNIELVAEGEINLATNLGLVLGLGVALPTAQGSEFNAANPAAIAGAIDQGSSDRFAVQRAVAMARGYEDNALFEPAHLGVVPELKLAWGERGKWKLDPWVKLENLIATSSGLAHDYVGELVFGVNAGYNVTKAFEPAVRVWVNAPLTGADFTTVAVVEPEVRLHFGDITPLVGVILPFAGPLTSPEAVGVRIGVGGRF